MKGAPVYEARVVVRNAPGIHARPAALLVQRASLFRSSVYIGTDRLTVNAKSIMGVLMLAAETGTELLLRAEGPDEREAVVALTKLIDSCFQGEEPHPAGGCAEGKN
jgi:phosphocarrier protein HPr